MSGGYIILHRKYRDNPVLNEWWKQAVWKCLIEDAAWQKSGITTTVRGIPIQLGHGELVLNKEAIASDCGKSYGKVRHFIKSLIDEGMITQRSIGKIVIIHLTNYEIYNSSATVAQQLNNSSAAVEQQLNRSQTPQEISNNNDPTTVEQQLNNSSATVAQQLNDNPLYRRNKLNKLNKLTNAATPNGEQSPPSVENAEEVIQRRVDDGLKAAKEQEKAIYQRNFDKLVQQAGYQNWDAYRKLLESFPSADCDKMIFVGGLKFLQEQGISEKKARGLLAGVKKVYSDRFAQLDPHNWRRPFMAQFILEFVSKVAANPPMEIESYLIGGARQAVYQKVEVMG